MNQFNIQQHFPLIAIIRGVTPDNCIQVAEILIEEGFTMIEVPLNSPNALESIQILVEKFGDEYLIGAGTVTTPDKAHAVIETGAKLVVTPNVNQDVIRLASNAGCVTFPGVVTPTEAFDALEAGATGLKLFPVSSIGLDGFKALKDVLPADTLCMPVGGVSANKDSLKPFVDLGANGFGLGSALYKPSMSFEEIRQNARAFVSAYKETVA